MGFQAREWHERNDFCDAKGSTPKRQTGDSLCALTFSLFSGNSSAGAVLRWLRFLLGGKRADFSMEILSVFVCVSKFRSFFVYVFGLSSQFCIRLLWFFWHWNVSRAGKLFLRRNVAVRWRQKRLLSKQNFALVNYISGGGLQHNFHTFYQGAFAIWFYKAFS